MKKIPIEVSENVLFKPLAVINKICGKPHFMDNLSLLTRLIDNMRSFLTKLERRRAELLSKKCKNKK